MRRDVGSAARRPLQQPARAADPAGAAPLVSVGSATACADVQLDQAWRSGFAEGHRDLMNADGSPPARPSDAIPSEVDPLEYWHLMGYQAGFRAAAEKLGI